MIPFVTGTLNPIYMKVIEIMLAAVMAVSVFAGCRENTMQVDDGIVFYCLDDAYEARMEDIFEGIEPSFF